MSERNRGGLRWIDELQGQEILFHLGSRKEILSSFEFNPARLVKWSEVEDQLPPGILSFKKYFDFQIEKVNKIAYLLESVNGNAQANEAASAELINLVLSSAISGVVSIKESEKIFEFFRRSKLEGWDKGRLELNTRYMFNNPSFFQSEPFGKYISLENAFAQADLVRKAGGKIISVMGTFDFHHGHAHLFDQARQMAGIYGKVFAFIISDEEAIQTRKDQQILEFTDRLTTVENHQGVDFCIKLPWKAKYKDFAEFDIFQKVLHSNLRAHFRLVGNLDSRSPAILKQCNSAGTRLVYVSVKRFEHASSTALRQKLINNQLVK